MAEDSAVIRAGLAELITACGHQVAAAVGDGNALLRAVAEHDPDLVIVDVRMPPTYTDDGLRAALELRRGRPGLPVLVFSQYVETRHVYDLLGAGEPGASAGVGYLLKDRVSDVAEFVAALERLAAGGTVLDPDVVNELLSASRRSDALSQLTAREREVLALMAEGRSNSAIAATLVVTPRAVEKHISNIFLKLGLPATDADHRRVLAVLRYVG
jgi:DNA-binding NarL/FixJ family response regulator